MKGKESEYSEDPKRMLEIDLEAEQEDHILITPYFYIIA
jgi:hypothetical protein